ncbi:Guanine nucleotide-binding protein alpha-4 subunit [Trametes pubescens]|uniref:Guanine nucleotide-binding protein alpha-4 subunit n=1 Tax=Trametes pubescens TaxID=154538 RepID=A0A1M2V782_TRAPU|nr:Guanine nucleotide-binding protein alpha-4 subunit [Trametes pubescens]
MPVSREPTDRDPLSAALRPPIDETEEEKAHRLADEEAAKRVSLAIDEAIRLEDKQRKKRKIVRLLLLGQSESGKSTTLRQFQRLYTPNAFREERVLWRAVIQLNIVRSIHTILDALSDIRRRDVYPSSIYTSEPDSDSESEHQVSLPYHLDDLRRRLYPLRHVESLLIAKLVPPNEHEATTLGVGGSNSVNGNVSYYGSGYSQPSHAFHNQEVFVRPGASWKLRTSGRPQSAGTTGQETIDESQTVLHHCRADIGTLWEDPVTRQILRRRKIRLEESPGFYLNDLDRVTSLSYFPSDDDVLRARLKTVGVSEYSFHMEAGPESGTEWRIIDSTNQRPTWVPFFDDVNAIIFLAPISAFDQTLVEDRSINRLEDSVLLWKEVCSNKLLAKVDLVLFLNKCDILTSKLKSGVRLAKYVRSFADRPNEPEVVEKLKDMVIREHLRASKLL